MPSTNTPTIGEHSDYTSTSALNNESDMGTDINMQILITVMMITSIVLLIACIVIAVLLFVLKRKQNDSSFTKNSNHGITQSGHSDGDNTHC